MVGHPGDGWDILSIMEVAGTWWGDALLILGDCWDAHCQLREMAWRMCQGCQMVASGT